MRYVLRNCPGSAQADALGLSERGGGGRCSKDGGNGLTFSVNRKLISNTDDTDWMDFHGLFLVTLKFIKL